jgi:hypothetical protein
LKMTKYNILVSVMCFLMVTTLPLKVLGANPSFMRYELKSSYNELLFSDFDGDGLDDIIIIDGPNLVFFFQDGKNGFTNTPNLIYSLGSNPSVVWHAKLGKKAVQDILVMTGEGVDSLSFVDRNKPPLRTKLINQQTIIPEKCEESAVVSFTLSANTAEEFPLVFVPAENGLEIWKYDEQWHCIYLLHGIPEAHIWGPYKTVGYTKQYWLNLNIGDLNGDGLEDLVICEEHNGKVVFKIYSQKQDGSFALKPSQSFEDKWDWRTWICFQDINKDGRVDVIKNKWIEEPWFLPATSSGKVLVQIFFADADGKIPDKPTYLFRKNDWISSMPVVDVDGDGFIDLVLGYGLFDSREGVRKTLTAKQLDHNLRIHFYNHGFQEQPDCQKDVTIKLEHYGIHFTWTRRDYLQTLISIDGDFNGDRRKDLLVADEKDKASVYFFISREQGFSKKPNIRFNNISQVKQFIINDLNKDGVSDLVVLSQKKDSFKVFLSKRK